MYDVNKDSMRHEEFRTSILQRLKITTKTNLPDFSRINVSLNVVKTEQLILVYSDLIQIES